MQAEDSAAFVQFIQHPLQVQLGVEKHRAGCPDISRYTGHGRQERYLLRVVGGAGEGANLPRELLWLWSGVHRATQLHLTLS